MLRRLAVPVALFLRIVGSVSAQRLRFLHPQRDRQAVAPSDFVTEDQQQQILVRHFLLTREHESSVRREPFLGKPFGAADLTRKVREVLDSEG